MRCVPRALKSAACCVSSRMFGQKFVQSTTMLWGDDKKKAAKKPNQWVSALSNCEGARQTLNLMCPAEQSPRVELQRVLCPVCRRCDFGAFARSRQRAFLGCRARRRTRATRERLASARRVP